MAVRRDDPYGGFNFIVEIDGLEVAAFSEVSGLGAEVELIEYRTGNSVGAPRRIPGLTRYPDLVLRRGIVGSLELWEWIESAARGRGEVARDMAVVLLDEQREPVLRWQLSDVRPKRYTSGPLRAAESELAMEELVLAYDGFDLD